MSDQTYLRQPVLDEYVAGGRRAVFVDSKVVVLSEIVLEAIDSGRTDFESIRAHLIDEFGQPEGLDVDDRVRQVLTELADSGIVQRPTQVAVLTTPARPRRRAGRGPLPTGPDVHDDALRRCTTDVTSRSISSRAVAAAAEPLR